MLNIFRIFATDAKRIFTNVVAIMVVMGLTVIPCLYAWFNILSNWDPYGPSATGNLPVAVCSEDKGTTVDTIEVNIGSQVIDNLKANNSIHWVFTDSGADAIEGVKKGTYYAALVMDEDFSRDMISFLGGDPSHPHMDYYENEKKNAIAPKITTTVKTTVQSEVNKTFVGTLADSILQLSSYAISEDRQQSFTEATVSRMHTLDTDLATIEAILNSYISLIHTTDSLMAAASSMTDEMDSIIESGSLAIDSAQSAAEAATNTANTASTMITGSLRKSATEIRSMSDAVTSLSIKTSASSNTIAANIAGMKTALSAIQSAVNQSIATTERINGGDYSRDIKQVNADFDALNSDLDAIEQAAGKTSYDASTELSAFASDLDVTADNVDALADTYEQIVEPQMNGMLSSLRSSLDEAEDLLNMSSSSIDSVAGILGNYPAMMGMGTESLEKSRDQVAAMKTALEEMIGKINSATTSEQYQNFLNILHEDPSVISSFVTSPVDVTEKPVFAVANNGSATSPFYVVLSIWVGALILIALIHTNVEHVRGARKIHTYQEYFGRYLVFFAIGQAQTLLTVLGAIYFCGIQMKHAFLFWFACSVTSFTFTLLNFSLKYAFGVVGEAISIVLMVIQVAGSGGTFPVEVLPKLYQVLYTYMPFAYGMNACRECIGGMYGADYWIYLSDLGTWVGASLFMGLVLSIPMKKLNEMIEEAKSKADIMA